VLKNADRITIEAWVNRLKAHAFKLMAGRWRAARITRVVAVGGEKRTTSCNPLESKL
jgi:hypothetical protein